MRKVTLLLVLVLAFHAAPAAACQWWLCTESETTATCSYFFCNGSGCVGGTVHFRGPIGRVDYNGVSIPFSDLLQWAMAQGSMPADNVYSIPNLALGTYRLCARTAEGEKCREGTLARGASLQIAVER